ncbi:D-alanyl-D-alanine carboxypeptidase [Streptomyces prunicolor]|uniref:D-alanyl-D-alanine carboxypeptidase n=1 Tax=Streptomyces prunicolor TaxID=67348 RepID=UPI00386F74B2|nr:D-alanyl-D-alanine carboxypeptidase [Streptomyces prunicolor]
MDTATKVFSIRELRAAEAEAEESAEAGEGTTSVDSEESEPTSTQNPSAKGGAGGDSRLREAVAAWVASADESGEADEPAASDRAAASDGADASDGSDASDASDSSERVADAESPEVAEEASADEDAEGDPEEPAEGAEAEDARETPSTGATDAETAEDAVEAGGGGSGATDGSGSGSGSGDSSGDSSAEVEPVDGDETRDAADAEAETETETETGDDVTEVDQVADAVADARTEAADTDSGDAPEDAVPEAGKSAAAEVGEAEADDAEAHAGAESKAAEGDATGTRPDDAKPHTEPEAAEGDTDADAELPAAAADPEPNPEPKAAGDGPAPQGPPAPDDETRTGGAGGNTKAAEGEAEAVDHPTAVFKAPRPPKPAVDQPTTMLKAPTAPTAPKTPESAPERTSKFVALKPLDEPRRDAPRRDTTRPVPQLGPEHTTQQPLPPKPPLDLLAELTNTPPPPETPVRTAIRRVKIWTPLVILLAIVFAVVQAVRPLPTPSLTLTAADSYTFDGDKANLPWPSEGQGWMDVNGIGTMGDFGKQTPVAIGSVAKAMTAYIVLKDHPLKAGTEGEKITVDATAEKEGGYDKDGESTLNTVKAGDVLTEKQALSAIMIPSANNIARLLARWDAGSEAAFIKKMNDTAKSLGMTNTTYTDASGLKETTVSSAEDQVKLGNQLVKIQALMDITKLPSWVDPSGHKWTNYNRLVPYNNSLGIKTGTTTAAGGNLLFAATKEVGGETAVIVGAILGQHTAPIIDTVNAVSKTAMLAAQDAMTSAKILKKGTVVGYVDDQLGGHTPVVVTKDVAAVGWAGLKVKLSFAPDAVPHTAKAGTQVGTLTVGDGSSGAVKVPVALQKDLAEPALTSKLTRLG